MTTLQADNISCTRDHRTLFTNLSFTVAPGQVLLVQGTNGSGKSSLLRLLAGLATPHTGNVLWQGQLIQQVRDEFIKQLHYLGHTNGIKLGLTAGENLQLAACLSPSSLASSTLDNDQLKVTTLKAAALNSAHDNILSALHLTEHLDTPAKYLSAGQQRKIALAKLMIVPKLLWVLDEPTTALDRDSQAIFTASLENHLELGGLCIMSSHQPLHLPHLTPLSLRLSS